VQSQLATAEHKDPALERTLSVFCDAWSLYTQRERKGESSVARVCVCARRVFNANTAVVA
jgi:hypothetical protein